MYPYLLILFSALFAVACQNTSSTGTHRADESLVPKLSAYLLDYMVGKQVPADFYDLVISHDSERAREKLILAVAQEVRGKDYAQWLGNTGDVFADSPIQLKPETATLHETKHRYKAPHYIACTSFMSIKDSSGRQYDIRYAYVIALGSSSQAPAWEKELHEKYGYSHSLFNFDIKSVKQVSG